MNKKIWTEKEDKYIEDNFGKVTYTEMANYLDCSITTVQKRAEDLGFSVKRKKANRWNEEEIELLKVMASKYLNKTIAKKLGRPVQEINQKARSLGIELIFKRPVWKKWKVKFLRENINSLPLSQIQKELEVSYYQIMEEIDTLGIEYKSDRWTQEEEEILTELSSKVYIREIAKVINRSEGAVIAKAKKMGLEYITLKREFSKEELDFIKANWGGYPATDIARALKVSRGMVQTQADVMHLPKLGNNPYRKWTENELEKLKTLSKKKTITELAKYFKTTNEAIQTVASRNNIEVIDEKIRWTEKENCLLEEYAKTMDISEISKKMNKSTSSIRLQAQRKGIIIQKNKDHQNSIWTDENDEQLKQLVDEGKTLIAIATIMNKKDATVLKKAKKLGLEIEQENQEKWSEEESLKLIELSKTKKLSEIVKELGRTSASIRTQAKKLEIKITPDRKQWTKEEFQILEHAVKVDKKEPKEIAEMLGRTEDAIMIKLNRMGIKAKIGNKKFWTEEEEILLTDLWGNKSLETIAKKLGRTVSSVRNKAVQLQLGGQRENNYDGLSIQDICDLFNISAQTIGINWVALGLQVKTRNISQVSSYRYVEIKDLYNFLEQNQNIWDSRLLEKNILGVEPDWLKEKRRNDKEKPLNYFKLDNITKQQLIQTKKINIEDDIQKSSEKQCPKQMCKKINKGVRI